MTSLSLQDTLDQFRVSWAERVGPAIARTIEADNAALAAGPHLARALRPGDAFPRVVLPDARGRPVDLGALADATPLVVTIYRGGWCPYCNLALRAYQAALAEIAGLGARLVAVSPEAPDHGLDTAQTNALAFPVLSDEGGRLAEALGIRFVLSPEIRALYARFGHDLPARHGGGDWSLPVPATYVVARGGRIALAHVEADYRRRLDPGEALAALRRLAAARAA
ncbi:peroxiredoxin-like family protein [Methylobacterium isbiliense]|jgi:peroxiredoxin|uniref:thioredoxin-dependent peroxiredoxin n=1 Tax=Methylobacterium isbiliense TaxID=315478 RepID=A0ABQ4SMP8_9HYPH|nr:peroxiredoxin-like family protein [Methylobacterium isbiliense]MDN3626392.1 peroxiredoxin-like family protein [Methylobacterium isbiliense]GJE03018.1 hypothetical protein GMJLKIPL_4969 [Methylobacterium isbiliense]